MAAMIGFGFVYFTWALFIDYSQQRAFRDYDGNPRNAQPLFTLPPDDDVQKEE